MPAPEYQREFGWSALRAITRISFSLPAIRRSVASTVKFVYPYGRNATRSPLIHTSALWYTPSNSRIIVLPASEACGVNRRTYS